MGSEHFKCSESLVSVRSGLDVTLDQKRARFQRVTLPHIPWIKAPARHEYAQDEHKERHLEPELNLEKMETDGH